MASWKDHMKDYDNCMDPTAKIKIDNKSWGSDNIIISRVNVSVSTGCEAGTCSVELTLPDVKAGSNSLKIDSDFSKVKIGVELEILLGYNVNKKPKVSTVFVGYISSFDLEVFEDRHAVLTIQGMDAKMWMMASCKTELKKDKKKYSDVVSGVYNNYASKFEGKKVSIKEESSFETPIYQRNESDYEFLCRVSSLTGALFFVSLGKFYFISPPTLKSVKLTIKPYTGIYNVRASMSIWGIPKTIETVSIDRKDFQKVVKGQATSSDTIGSGKSASSLTKNIGATNLIKIIDNTLQSVNEAKFISEAEYNKRELNLVEGTLNIAGDPDIELATGLKIDKMGDPIDNTYIVTGLEHSCDLANKKYVTIVRLNTNRYSPQTSSLF